jgi:hypothetical protein
VEPTSITLGPVGDGELTERLHAGAGFDVYAGAVDDKRICVKTPARTPVDADAVFSASTSLIHTRVYANISRSGSRGFETRESAAPLVGAGDLLGAEHARIAATNGAWNHTSSWFGRSHIHGSDAPILVMPRHQGRVFSALDRGEQRRLFPMMLPALWDAVEVSMHGDLHPANIIVAPASDRFSLIDPGVYVQRENRYSGGSWTRAAFTTNADGYPILPPYCKPAYPLDSGASPREQLGSFIGAMSGYARQLREGTRPSVIAAYLHGIGSPPRNEPHVADLMAAGVIYYRILLDRHPWYDDVFTEPAWLGGETGDADILEGFGAALSRVEHGVPPPRDIDATVTEGESHLAVALAEGRITSRRQLTDLVGAALTR